MKKVWQTYISCFQVGVFLGQKPLLKDPPIPYLKAGGGNLFDRDGS